MTLLFRIISIGFLTSFCGCELPLAKVASERRSFLEDPSTGSYGYDGKIVSGRHYLFLAHSDQDFGKFLMSVVPSADQPEIVVAALTYFAWTKPDRSKFEQVVRSIKTNLLSREVIEGNTDEISIVSLAEWIEDVRRDKAWANQSLEPTPTAGTSAAEQPLVPAAGVAHL